MVYKDGQSRGNREVVRKAISAILRGGDYSNELTEAIGMHQQTEQPSEQFEKTFLRATRINLSPRTSKVTVEALNAQPDQKALATALSMTYKRLDMAVALNNIAIASSIIERLLDKFDRMIGVERQNGRYGTLEHQLGKKLAEGDWSLIKHNTVAVSAYIGSDPVLRSTALGNLLDLGQRSQDQLLDLYLSVTDPIDLHARSMQVAKNMSRLDITNPDELTQLNMSFAKEFMRTVQGIFNANRLNDKRSIKAVIVYPLMISTLNPGRKTDSGLSGAMISRIIEMEPDLRLRSMIELLDHAVSPEQKEKN